MANKPVPPIRVESNPFGEFSEEQLNGMPGAKDKFYLAGYSDKRFEREMAIKTGEKPTPLPYRFQYVSIQKSDGAPDKAKYVDWQARGYRAVQYDELASFGIDPEKSTCERGPNGEARCASQVLMVCDAKTAAYHYNRNQQLIAEQFRLNVEEPLQEAADRYNVRHGRTNKSGTKATVETKVSKTAFELE